MSLIFLFLTFFTQGQVIGDVKFEELTIRQGLSNDQVNFVFEDQEGFIWISTLSGLNRYDGYEVKTFYHDGKDTTSLASNTTLWMSYGPDGKLWVKNASGINTYDPATEQFSYPQYYYELLQTEPAYITQMVMDPYGTCWFNIENRGLVAVDSINQVFEANSSEDAKIHLSSSSVSHITLGKSGNLWLSHESGLIEVINPVSNKVIRKYGFPEELSKTENYWKFTVDGDQDVWAYTSTNPCGVFYLNTKTGQSKIYNTPEIKSNLVTGVIQTNDGKIWIGADHGGIAILNKVTGEIQPVLNDPDDPQSLVNNNVNNLFLDSNGGIWVATIKSGVSYYHPSSSRFRHVKYDKKISAYNDMSSFAEDGSGNLWIGTNGQGLLKYNLRERAFKPLSSQVSANQPNVVVSLLNDSQGNIWVGTYLKGLHILKDGRLKPFALNEHSAAMSIWELYEDSNGMIWIGTINNGVYRYNPNDQSVFQISMSNGLMANYVTCIEEDDLGNIWLGTGNGLTRFNPRNEELFTLFESTSDLTNNSIISLKPQGNYLWIGTLDGLNQLDLNTMEIEVYRKSEGLSSNIVMSIEEDRLGNMWLGTDHGITKVMTRPEGGYQFHTFDQSDGLQAENFTEDASYETSEGQLIFAGQNGFNIFQPQDISIEQMPPRILLTGVSINNQPLEAGADFNGRVILKQVIWDTKHLELKHDENSLSFEYLALSFFQSGKLRYQYQLEEFDQDWMNAPMDLRKVNYANLDYGDYTFKVRASSGTNSWTEPIHISIHISPPFWETPLAFATYLILVVLILSATRSYIVHRERLKASIENERKETERQHQLDMMKIKFFTNISHEFRTPLSLILTPIERMINRPEQIQQRELMMVQRNAKRLMTLVNQLLDFRKMEANQHTLSQSSGDIISFLQDVIDSFSDWSKEKDIPVVFNSELKSYYTFFDKDKMEKIMFNLLSNAFKFTMSGGKITVDFELQKSEGGPHALIAVSDTGIGIPNEKLDLIFNRFFQNEISPDIINNGTGIGLSITKEFVELHKGKISVDSKENMGTTFTIDLPLKEINSEEDLADELVKELAESFTKKEVEAPADRENLPTVLLVEDNFDFRFYLKDNLKQHYNIQVASNGKEAWKSILNRTPDIVITDVMMPVMDGLELCEKIKSDPRTLQIPVIMLTAQSSDRHRIQGLEAGAIEYISKPFNFEILLSSINSALKFQKRVQESGNRVDPTPKEAEVVSLDDQLIAKAVLLVEENMSNSEFSVEDLSHELGYSRGHFYQKILRLTGQTPIDFIRNLRMKRAADLLQRSQLNVSEVAYKVGYNNPKLFSRYFKSIYNAYPSEFRASSENTKRENEQKLD